MNAIRNITRANILLAALSILGGAVTTNEALRHLRRTTTRQATFGLKAALAALSLTFAVGFIILCLRYIKDTTTHAQLRMAAFIGIGVELLYQGFELSFYARPLLQSSPASKIGAMTFIIQLAIFGLWMLVKIIAYITLARALSKEHT